jgi:hypothetical protein
LSGSKEKGKFAVRLYRQVAENVVILSYGRTDGQTDGRRPSLVLRNFGIHLEKRTSQEDHALNTRRLEYPNT